MTTGRELIMCILLLFQLGSQGTVDSPKPLEICDVLENLNLYAGKTVVVRAKWEGTLEGSCKPPQSSDDPRTPVQGRYVVNGIAIAPLSADAERTALLKTQLQDIFRLSDEGYGVMATFTGRLEVKPPGRLGFGHLGSYPAQIVLMRIEDVKRSGKKHRRKSEFIEK
jgi:hypothetical protein